MNNVKRRKTAALAAPGTGIIQGTVGWAVENLQVLLADRVANGDSLPGERVVRLPRRLRDLSGREVIQAQRTIGKGGRDV